MGEQSSILELHVHQVLNRELNHLPEDAICSHDILLVDFEVEVVLPQWKDIVVVPNGLDGLLVNPTKMRNSRGCRMSGELLGKDGLVLEGFLRPDAVANPNVRVVPDLRNPLLEASRN